MCIRDSFYAIWYARWELAVYSGDLSTDAVIDTGERWRINVITFIESVGAVRLGMIVLVAVTTITAVGQITSDRRVTQKTDDNQ